MRVIVTRCHGGTAMRTPDVTGDMHGFPWAGCSLRVYSAPLDPRAHLRIFETSEIREAWLLADGAGVLVDTRTGSRYLVEAA